MSEPGRETTTQLSSGVSVTIVKVMCGSPAGMGQLIKYFESQSRRLDRQTVGSCPSSLNPDFESAIKFNGVPILPPAITSSRRDELRQLKKDAVLLEKRLKARHRRELLDKADSLVNQSRVYYPDTSIRQAARQLNFDSGGHEEPSRVSQLQVRLGNSFDAANTGNSQEDFGLQTMDSVNSDFMSLDSDSIPRVFSGLVLTSVKEQKISYDLDRLSKALNVQDLASTSGSDLSDAMDFSQTQNRKDLSSVTNKEDFQNPQYLEEKNSPVKAADESDSHLASSFGSNDDTVVRATLELGKTTSSAGTSNFENIKLKNADQIQNSLNSALECGFVNTSTTVTDGQWSNRSSPKSLKNGVHFASFVTEYINISASQTFEHPTVVKKKMSPVPDTTKEKSDRDTVVPIIADLGESHRRSFLSRKVSTCENGGGLLENVSFCLDSDSSPVTPPFNKMGLVPFQIHGRSEAYSSDKENDASQLYKQFPQAHKRSIELGSKLRNNLEEKGSTEPYGGERRQQKPSDEKNIGKIRIGAEDHSFSPPATSNYIPRGVEISQDLSIKSTSSSVGASQLKTVADSVSLVLGSITSVAAKMEKVSVSDSQGSSKSNTLTNTSESSSGTVKEDCPMDKSTVSMNIVDTGVRTDSMNTDQRPDKSVKGNRNVDSEDQQSDSPKKLNTEGSVQEVVSQDKPTTPNRNNICRNSYTLSEPSPALVQAQGRLGAEKKEKIHEQRTILKTFNTVSNFKQPNVGQTSPKRVQSAPVKSTEHSESTAKMHMPSDTEREGKAEHINKYLNQVQFQNSMNFTGQSWETRQLSAEYAGDAAEEDMQSLPEESLSDECPTSVVDVLKSIAESHGSLDQLSIEELLELHQQQMNEKRQALIRQQQRDMEELFVQQRREVMLLEGEIKAAQLQGREQQKFLVQNAPENIKVKSRNQNGEYSPRETGNFEQTGTKQMQQNPSAKNSNVSNILSDSSQHQLFNQLPSGSPSPVSGIKLQPKSYKGVEARSNKFEQIKPKSHIQPRNYSMISGSPDSIHDDSQTSLKTTSGSNYYSRNIAGVEAIEFNRTPEFSPSVSSLRMHRPVVLRSPMRYTPLHRRSDRVVLPPEAFLPQMQVKFDKLTAVAKGFLTRRLLKSDKVQELIKTIRDTREFAFSFQTETPIKRGMFTSQDKVLLERIIAQLQAAVLDIHEIFFEIPTSERLALIEQTRLSEQEKKAKAASKDSMRESGPKISQATLKALERKRKSRETEASAVVSMSRPKTAPARTSSPQYNNHTDSRALRPLQGHSQIAPTRPDTISDYRPEKGRTDTAKEKQMLTQPRRIQGVPNKSASILVKTSNNDSYMKGSVKLSVTTNQPMTKLKPSTNKPSGRPLKSWR